MFVTLNPSTPDAIRADLTVEYITPSARDTHPYALLLRQAGFKEEYHSHVWLHEHATLIYALDAHADGRECRLAMRTIVQSLQKMGYATIAIPFLSDEALAAFAEGAVLGSYRFESYRSDRMASVIQEIFLSTHGSTTPLATLQESHDRTLIIAKATNFTRDLVNQTPYDMTPQGLAIVAQELASSHKHLHCTLLDVPALEDEKMEAMLAVGRGSINPPRLIHLHYTPTQPARGVITLVGKGLTYDSGGLSLKPSTSMVTMKMDKAGACAVLGILKAVHELKLPIEVHGLIGAVENMIGPNAYKPDDILRAKNGVTIEVRNTDAEGRLVLADVLSYAQETIDSDYLFDFATLTGACMVALGPYTTGIMGHNQTLIESWMAAAQHSGEYAGHLPFNPYLGDLLKSAIADVSNVASKPYGGAITAALFLDRFVTPHMKDKWLHFDIAGSAYTESPWDLHPYGGTGAGVRMSLEWLIQRYC